MQGYFGAHTINPPPGGSFSSLLGYLKADSPIRRKSWPEGVYIMLRGYSTIYRVHEWDQGKIRDSRKWLPEHADLLAEDWVVSRR